MGARSLTESITPPNGSLSGTEAERLALVARLGDLAVRVGLLP
jgi:hypothetical protein